MASSLGSEFVLYCGHFRSPFERTIIDPAVTLYFMSGVPESYLPPMVLAANVYIQILIVCPDLDEYAQILMYIREF